MATLREDVSAVPKLDSDGDSTKSALRSTPTVFLVIKI